MNDPDVLAVLRAYPQIYLAAHVEHRTRGSSSTGLTSRDSSFLAHVADPIGSSPAALARHLGIARSSLSEALSRLERQGLIEVTVDPEDARRRVVRLSPAGREAMVQSSVLDPGRVGAMLATLDDSERERAVRGLELLAEAASRYRTQGES
ncbi:MarR family winged helix-turn-helix transcriptional regulator [Allosphingosinicella sp.]|jgi:DNA-binding MarR family transcriptional regulator|uniref:MarR family winged helix-turn-helix transcriptional regulator n=1 Tax=Allosphingosinicella sp. TaxID=2823234 RepID=UPI002EFA7421